MTRTLLASEKKTSTINDRQHVNRVGTLRITAAKVKEQLY
jgi:hypothetical protein